MRAKFKSSRPGNRTYVLKQLILALVVIAIWPVYKILFSNGLPSDSYYFIAGSVLIVTIVREAIRVRVIEIEFNPDDQLIIFNYQYLFSKTKQEALKFKFATLEVETKMGLRGASPSIYFLSNKVEMFKVDKGKDGFSNQTLKDMCDTADKLSLPVSKY